MDIIKRDYDLSAKNPNKAKSVVYKSSKELVKGILQEEKKIATIVKEIKIS